MERYLKTFGCSNTFGAELVFPKKDAWPFVLGKLLDLPVENYGKCGASNEEIIELAITNSLSNPLSIIVILKTEESRLYWPINTEFNKIQTKKNSFNFFYGRQEKFSNNDIANIFNNVFNLNVSYDDLINSTKFNYIVQEHPCKKEIIEFYNEIFQVNNLSKYKSIGIFPANKIPSVKQWILYNYNKESIINHQNFLFNTCKELLTFRGHIVHIFDFKDLVMNINCKKGALGHYLEEGNKVMAEIIYEKIQTT